LSITLTVVFGPYFESHFSDLLHIFTILLFLQPVKYDGHAAQEDRQWVVCGQVIEAAVYENHP